MGIKYNRLQPAAFGFAPSKAVARQSLLFLLKFWVIEHKCLGVEAAAGSLLSNSGKMWSSCTSEKVLTKAQGSCLAKGGNERLCKLQSVGLRFGRSHGLIAPKQRGWKVQGGLC